MAESVSPRRVGTAHHLQSKVGGAHPTTTTKRTQPRCDWRSWLALAWAAWFGVLYARMVLEERAPEALRAIERAVGSIRIGNR
jgi:hypothetical protein